MKHFSGWLLIAAVSLTSSWAYAEDQVVTLTVQDISCGNCTNMVKRVLGRIDGVKNVAIKSEKGEAVVTYDSNRTNAESLIDVAALAGYPTAIKR